MVLHACHLMYQYSSQLAIIPIVLLTGAMETAIVYVIVQTRDILGCEQSETEYSLNLCL